MSVSLWACGHDGTNSVAGQCGSACADIAHGCAVPAPNVSDCSAACTVAGGLAPACSGQYASVIACARSRPLLACQDRTVSVTIAGDCLAPLADYLVCAANSVVPICVDLPLQNTACNDLGLPRAAACVGESPGCVLQAGAMLDSQGVGLFCCPP
ncbi:MAG: hypothetical protein ACHQ53_02955 [Polyangiales bacterium]